MNYEYAWKVLEELMVDLTKKGTTVPQILKDDMKSAKFYISIYKSNPTALEVVADIQRYVGDVESNLLYLAESDVGIEYADKWRRKIYRAHTKEAHESAAAVTRFVTAVPKGEYSIRINLSGLMKDEEVRELLKTLALSSVPQENGYVLVHGREENVKTFVKRIRGKIGKNKK